MSITEITTPSTATPEPAPSTAPSHRIHWGWLGAWVVLTTFAWFEVIKHGFVNGSALEAAMLTGAAVGFFIAPDLTFLIGIGDGVQQGHLARRAVPWYNGMHRMWVPATLTTVVGIGLAPLAFGPLVLFVGGVSWMAHIAMDRAAGYHLRNADGSR